MVNKENKNIENTAHVKPKEGAGIADEKVRKQKELTHKGRPGEIDDEEIENTYQKGFDRTGD
ncbi:MAG: hypothetical protein ACK40G_13090 [Cytophagaceae bacterium]